MPINTSSEEGVKVAHFADDADRLLEEGQHVSRDASPLCYVIRLSHEFSREVLLVQLRHQFVLPDTRAAAKAVTA